MNLRSPTHRVPAPPFPHQRRTERIERRPAATVRIDRSDTIRDDGPPTEPLPRLDASAPPQRLRGVDAARGVALIGMIAVHTLPLTDGAGRSTLVGSVFGGTSAALFGFLAGVSVALLTGRRQVVPGGGAGRRHALRLAVRGLVVGALGLLLGDLAAGSVDIILTYYGVLFLLAVPLVFLPTRALFATGAALMVLAPVTDFLVRAQLAPVELQDPSFGYLATDPVGLLSTLLFTGAYPAWPWLTYLCLGLAVGRCSLERTRTAATLAVGGVVLAVLAAVASTALLAAGGAAAIRANPGLPPEGLASALAQGPDGVTPTSTWWWLAVDLPHSATPLFLAYTVGTSLAVLGAMLLLDGALARPGTAARVVGAVRAPLVAAGSMTLTFYTLHVLVSGAAPEAGAGAFLLVQVGVALAVGYLWRARIGKGPLERAVGTVVDAVGRPPARRDGQATGPRTALVVLAAVVAVLSAVGGAAAVVVTATAPAAAVAPSAPEEDEAPTGEDTAPAPGPRPTSDPEDAPDSAEDTPDAPDEAGSG